MFQNIAIVSFFVAVSAFAQSGEVTAVVNGQITVLVAHQLGTTDIAVPAGSPKRDFLTGAVKGQVANKVTGVAMTSIVTSGIARVPFAGTAVILGGEKLKNMLPFGKKKSAAVETYRLAFLQGETVSTEIVANSEILIPAGIRLGSRPALLKVTPSASDKARIVRSVRTATVRTKSAINPMQSEILGVEEQVVPVKIQGEFNGDTTVIPETKLEVGGEYVLVLIDPGTDEARPSGWDFRVR